MRNLIRVLRGKPVQLSPKQEAKMAAQRARADATTRCCGPGYHRSDVRPPLEVEYHPPPSFASEVFEMFNPLSPSVDFPQLFNRNEKPSRGPYCGKVEG